MCRFGGLDDIEYKKAVAAIRRVLAADDNKRLHFLDALRFDQIDARHETIRAAYSDTCKWLIKHPTYQDWLDNSKLPEHHAFLWVCKAQT